MRGQKSSFKRKGSECGFSRISFDKQKYMIKMEKNGAHKQMYRNVAWDVTTRAEESQSEDQCKPQLVRKGS